jgi:hypothetical protein
MHANPALLDNNTIHKPTHVILFKSKDHNVDATNTTTKPQTNVSAAHKVNSPTTTRSIRMVSARMSNKLAMPQDKYNWDRLNATDAQHAQLDNNWTHQSINAKLFKYKDQFVDATNNTTQQPTLVIPAQPVNCQEMVDLNRTSHADHTHKIAMPLDKFNWINSIATDAKPVPVDNNLLEMSAKPKDQHVAATNSTIHQQTDVKTAQLANCQEMVELNRTLLADHTNNLAMLKDKSNWTNSAATDAKLVPVDNNLLEMHAKLKDQFAAATNNTTQQLTLVTPAQPANCQETVEFNRISHADHSNKLAMPLDKFNWINSIATDAKLVLVDKDLLEMFAKLQDQLVVATNNTILQLTPVTTAQQDNCQETVELNRILLADLTHKIAMPLDKFNWTNSNATDAKHALVDNNFKEMFALPQDQHAHATNNTIHKPTDVTTAQ